MQPITVTQARKNLSDIVDKVGFNAETQIITRKGKQIVAIIPIQELRLLEKIEDCNDLMDAREALADIKENGTITWEHFEKELGL